MGVGPLQGEFFENWSKGLVAPPVVAGGGGVDDVFAVHATADVFSFAGNMGLTASKVVRQGKARGVVVYVNTAAAGQTLKVYDTDDTTKVATTNLVREIPLDARGEFLVRCDFTVGVTAILSGGVTAFSVGVR